MEEIDQLIEAWFEDFYPAPVQSNVTSNSESKKSDWDAPF